MFVRHPKLFDATGARLAEQQRNRWKIGWIEVLGVVLFGGVIAFVPYAKESLGVVILLFLLFVGAIMVFFSVRVLQQFELRSSNKTLLISVVVPA